MIDPERLCRAFCDNLTIRPVGVGVAVSTVFSASDGDTIGFYIQDDSSTGLHRIEDNGLVFPMLEASGFDRRSETRAAAMNDLLDEYGVALDEDTREFYIEQISEEDLPTAAMRFVAFSLRARDLAFLTEMRVATTFRDDVRRMLLETVAGRAQIEEATPISSTLADFVPDFVLRPSERPPVAIWLGNSDAKVLEALFVYMRTTHEVHEPCSVVALLERGDSVTAPVRQQATNRLARVPEFRGDEVQAIQKIADEAFGEAAH